MATSVTKQQLIGLLPDFLRDWVRERWLLRRFRSQFHAFTELQARSGRNLQMAWEDRWPCLYDATSTTPFEKHYLYHLAWAARVLARTRPLKHVDVSSALQFACIASAFIPIEYYELRPVSLGLDGLTTSPADIVRLPIADKSVDSLSCMHVVEHIGLGRYGDALDADGDLKAMRELRRVLAPRGNLLFVVPVGVPRIQFNAHRVYSYEAVLAAFPDLRLIEFSLITDYDDARGLVSNAPPELADKQHYGCGCFWFQAPPR